MKYLSSKPMSLRLTALPMDFTGCIVPTSREVLCGTSAGTEGSSMFAGMAAPVWVSAVSSTPVGACVPALSTTFSGIMVLGIADSAASAIGRRFGRHRILGTRKTLEGTLGAILCTVVGWLVLWPMCRCRGHENLDRCALHANSASSANACSYHEKTERESTLQYRFFCLNCLTTLEGCNENAMCGMSRPL